MQSEISEINELNIQQVIAEYIAEGALIAQPQVVYRLNTGNHRYYYTFDQEGEPTFYTSVTTMLAKTMQVSGPLQKWMVENFKTMDEYYEFLESKADYGTFMHIEISKMLINKGIDLDNLHYDLIEYIEINHLDKSCMRWLNDIKKDLLAFAKFVIDKNVITIAIEMVIASEKIGIAGAIDLVCEMDFKGKRVIALIDNKSGRKGFFESHELQLHCYAQMWNDYFTEKQIEMVFNWSPKDWRGETPTYNFKNQTLAESRHKLQHLIAINRINDFNKDKAITTTSGIISLENKDISENIKLINLSEAVKNEKQDTKTGH